MHNTKDEPFHQTASLPKIFSLILYFTRKQVGEMNWFSRKLKKVTEEFRKDLIKEVKRMDIIEHKD